MKILLSHDEIEGLVKDYILENHSDALGVENCDDIACKWDSHWEGDIKKDYVSVTISKAEEIDAGEDK